MGGLQYLTKQKPWYQFSMKNKNTKWKSSNTRSGGHLAEDKKLLVNFQLENKPSIIRPPEVLPS